MNLTAEQQIAILADMEGNFDLLCIVMERGLRITGGFGFPPYALKKGGPAYFEPVRKSMARGRIVSAWTRVRRFLHRR